MGSSYSETPRQQAQAQQFQSCLSLQLSGKSGQGQTEVWAIQKVARNTATAHEGRREHASREMPGGAVEHSTGEVVARPKDAPGGGPSKAAKHVEETGTACHRGALGGGSSPTV